MLRTCTKEEFDRYIDFAYDLATDLTKSGYPTYCDKIKTKETFIDNAHKAFERDTEEMLLFVLDGQVQGFIQYYLIPEDRYLQLSLFNINTATDVALSEFLEYIGGRYGGYDVYFGLPAENRSAAEFLAGRGFECIENDYNNTAFLDEIVPVSDETGLTRICKENYPIFETLHNQIEGDMYWNSERMLADLDDWVVFVKERDGRPAGAVYYRTARDGWFEIFGIDIDQDRHDPELFRELLGGAVSDAKNNNGKFITFFCDEEYEEITKQCGFFCVGNYLCFKTHLD